MKKVLYITYLGLLEPIPNSQVLPYLLGLAKETQIYLLSYEKKDMLERKPAELDNLRKKLSNAGIIWYRLNYHKRPLVFSSFFDICLGIFASLFIVIRHKTFIIHARANIPIAVAFILKLFLPIKIIYDRRGMMGDEHVEHSGWKSGGLLHNAAVRFERIAMSLSDVIVVLTEKMNTQLRRSLRPADKPRIKTIPCCVEPRFLNHCPDSTLRRRLGLSDDCLILVYSGSLGTYNLLDEMLDFFKILLGFAGQAHFLILTQNDKIARAVLAKRQDLETGSISVYSVSYEELPSWLGVADAGIIFRRHSPTAIAASPTKFSAYLACGIPVIAAAWIGDLSEVIMSRDIGVVISDYDRESYISAAKNLIQLLKDKENLKIRCRRTAEEIFPLARGIRVYSQIYNSLT
jgi:glycosyltransferase involved in cell wall biosynthesis